MLTLATFVAAGADDDKPNDHRSGRSTDHPRQAAR